MTFAFIALLLITICASAAVHLIGWLRDRRAQRGELPPLVLPMTDGIRREPDFPSPPPSPPVVEEVPIAAPPAPALTAAALPPAAESPDAPAAGFDTVRLPRATEDAIQLLPARFEVIAGMTRQQEIRFVRTPGQPPHMILGREPGASPHHVSLGSSTVSRRHARVAFADGRWTVVNLSRTNPVVVNDRALAGTRTERVLADGDRIELGDVVLRFRAS